MRRTALLIALLLLLPLAQAGGPNGRGPQDFGHPVVAVAISGDGGHVAVGLEDEGDFLGGDSDQEVWNLLEVRLAALADVQGGDADDEECGLPLQVDDECSNSATAIALSADGSSLVIAAPGSDGDTTLVFADRGRGEDDRVVVPGVVAGLAISADGGEVVVALNDGDAGNVRYYDVGTSASERWSHSTDEPVTALALSDDGLRAVAAAGGDAVLLGRSKTIDPFVDSLPSGSTTSVAVSDHPEHYAIVGTSTGAFRLYSDTSVGSETIEANIRGTGAITSVAIDPDGEHIVVARDGGAVQVFALDESVVGIHVGALTASATMAATIRDVTVSGDGSHLLLRSDQSLWHLTLALERLWATQIEDEDGAIAIDAAAISHDGGRVVAAAGGRLHLFEAFHDLMVDVQHPGGLQPGQAVNTTVTLRNGGNRIDQVTLTLDGPTGWNATLASTEVRLLPDETVIVPASFQVPDHAAPGGYDLDLDIESAQGTSGQEVAVDVATVASWWLDAGPEPTSLSVASGGTVSFTLTAHNTGNIPGKPAVQLDVQTPGWAGRTIQSGNAIPAGDSRDVLISLTAPDDAKKLDVGQARVRIGNGTWVPLQATVGASFGLSLTAPGDVDVASGSVAEVPVTLRNTGNAPDAYRLTVEALPAGWTVTWNGLASEAVTESLEAGAEGEAILHIAVPAGTPGQNIALSIHAESLADDDVQKTRNVLLRVDGADATELDEPDEPSDKKQPGFAPIAALAAVAAVAWMRRR